MKKHKSKDIKTYLKVLAIAVILLDIYGIYGITRTIYKYSSATAEECVPPGEYNMLYQCRNVTCKGLPSYPTFQFEACLPKCNEDYDAAYNAQQKKYDDCLNQKQQQQSEADRLRQEREEQQRQQQAELEQQQEEQRRLEQQRAQQQSESQSIHQPVQDLQKELQTPGPEIQPPPILTPPAVNVQYLEMKDIQKGQTITAPANQKIDIPLPNGKIDVKEGSIIQYLGESLWKTIKGAVRFLEQTSQKKRSKMMTPTAVCAVRGTQFITEVADDGTTKVRVYAGIVTVSPTTGKKSVDVKAGFQTTVGKGAPAKPTPIDTADTWYQDILPGTAWFDMSWQKTSAANQYQKQCVYTAGASTPTQTLTADEEQQLTAFNQALAQFRVKINDIIIEKEKKASFTKEKTTMGSSAKAAQIMMDAAGIYYAANPSGPWKGFKDKKIMDSILQAVRQENITFGADRGSLQFERWESVGNARAAVYTATANATGNESMIEGALGKGSAAGQEPAVGRIYINEESGLWDKSEMTANIKSGKITFPLKETCEYTYGAGVKIKAPTKLKRVDAKTGIAEMYEAIGAVN